MNKNQDRSKVQANKSHENLPLRIGQVKASCDVKVPIVLVGNGGLLAQCRMDLDFLELSHHTVDGSELRLTRCIIVKTVGAYCQ